MTPDVVVDIGNTRMKWGRCAGGRVAEMVSLPLDEPGAWAEQLAAWGLNGPVKWAAASVNPAVSAQFQEWATDTGDEVQFINDYRGVPLAYAVDLPEQVGIDRLMNAFAAHCIAHPHPAVVVSVGTATTIDLVDEKGVFHGGAILPGPRLMAHALHAHTAKLPLVDADTLPTVVAPGKNTADAILAGIRASIVGRHHPPRDPLRGSGRNPVGVHHRRRRGRPRPVRLRGAVQGDANDPPPDARRRPDRRGVAAVSDTTVSLLTAPGTGAIATVVVHGPRAWELARQLFTPAGKPLPESPEVNRFWFGTLGNDEVVLAVSEPRPEGSAQPPHSKSTATAGAASFGG